MNNDIQIYHTSQATEDKAICDVLHEEICKHLPKAENRVWHGHPVWFLDGNPIVGYSKLKAGLQLMFWSGVSFEEEQLVPGKSGKFKDAAIFYTSAE